jgi:hypothetical protein
VRSWHCRRRGSNPRPCGHWILSPARLPIPPRRRFEKERDDTASAQKLKRARERQLSVGCNLFGCGAEIIADNLSKTGWSWGCISAVDFCGRTIWIVDAHRSDQRLSCLSASQKEADQQNSPINSLSAWRLLMFATTPRNERSALGMYCRKCLWPFTRPRKP